VNDALARFFAKKSAGASIYPVLCNAYFHISNLSICKRCRFAQNASVIFRASVTIALILNEGGEKR